MSSASSMCQTYPNYTSDAPEDVSTALHGSGEGSLCTQGHASCGSPLYTSLDRYTVQTVEKAKTPSAPATAYTVPRSTPQTLYRAAGG